MAARKLTVYKAAEAELVAFEKDYSSIIVDCSTPAGLKSAKACRKDIKDVRLNLEDLRKETKAPVLAKGKQIDTEAKAIAERLLVLETKFDTAIKAIENAKAIAQQEELDNALAKVRELEEREAAIVAKEIELGLREPEVSDEENDVADSPVNDDSASSPSDNSRDSSPAPSVKEASVICEPHIKAAAERLSSLRAIRNLVEPTDAQPDKTIDKDIARAHDEALAAIWDIVDAYK
jgi:hypothetical protein